MKFLQLNTEHRQTRMEYYTNLSKFRRENIKPNNKKYKSKKRKSKKNRRYNT